MCGRYTITTDAVRLEKRFDAKFDDEEFQPSANASPSQKLPVIFNISPKVIKLTHWGIHYAWMDMMDRNELINIRKETLAEKQTFKKLLNNKRCLVLSDGFYEWKKVGSKKVPYQFMLKSKELFTFAGLWDEVENDRGEIELAFAIITTVPNELVAKVHNRMPVILERGKEKIWLNGDKDNLRMLGQYAEDEMVYFPVTKVG